MYNQPLQMANVMFYGAFHLQYIKREQGKMVLELLVPIFKESMR